MYKRQVSASSFPFPPDSNSSRFSSMIFFIFLRKSFSIFVTFCNLFKPFQNPVVHDAQSSLFYVHNIGNLGISPLVVIIIFQELLVRRAEAGQPPCDLFLLFLQQNLLLEGTDVRIARYQVFRTFGKYVVNKKFLFIPFICLLFTSRCV